MPVDSPKIKTFTGVKLTIHIGCGEKPHNIFKTPTKGRKQKYTKRRDSHIALKQT